MAGEDQYIHPIVQALMSGVQNQLENRRLAAQVAQQQNQQQNAQQELKIRQQLADQAQQTISNEHDYRQELIKNEQSRLAAEQGLYDLQARKAIQDIIMNGGSSLLATSGNAPQPAQPNAPGIIGGIPATPDTRTIQLPSGATIPFSSLPTRDDLLNAEMAKARGISGAQTQGQLESAEPFKISQDQREFQNKRQLQQDENGFRTQLNNSDIASREKINQMDIASRQAIANMENSTQLQRTKAEYGLTDDGLRALVVGGATGQYKLSPTNPREMQAITAMGQQGFRNVSDKEASAMRELGQLPDVYNKIENLAEQLPDGSSLGPIAATANALGMSSVAHSALSTDLKQRINELAPAAFNLVKNAQGYTGNRMNSQEMAYVQNGLTNVGTKQQALHYLQSIKDTIDNRITNVIEAGMPQAQQNMNYHTNGLTPAWITQARNSPDAKAREASGLTVNVPDSITKGQLVYDSPGQ